MLSEYRHNKIDATTPWDSRGLPYFVFYCSLFFRIMRPLMSNIHKWTRKRFFKKLFAKIWIQWKNVFIFASRILKTCYESKHILNCWIGLVREPTTLIAGHGMIGSSLQKRTRYNADPARSCGVLFWRAKILIVLNQMWRSSSKGHYQEKIKNAETISTYAIYSFEWKRTVIQMGVLCSKGSSRGSDWYWQSHSEATVANADVILCYKKTHANPVA